jgi:hypothetical protein
MFLDRLRGSPLILEITFLECVLWDLVKVSGIHGIRQLRLRMWGKGISHSRPSVLVKPSNCKRNIIALFICYDYFMLLFVSYYFFIAHLLCCIIALLFCAAYSYLRTCFALAALTRHPQTCFHPRLPDDGDEPPSCQCRRSSILEILTRTIATKVTEERRGKSDGGAPQHSLVLRA